MSWLIDKGFTYTPEVKEMGYGFKAVAQIKEG
jgi:hypothetical protein